MQNYDAIIENLDTNNLFKIKYAKSNMRQSIYKNIVEFILCLLSTVGHGSYHEVWSIYAERLHWKELSFLMQV